MKKLSIIAISLFSLIFIAACNNSKSEKTEKSEDQKQVEKKTTSVPQVSKQKYFQAALKGDYSTVNKAIETGTDVNATNQNGSTALMLAGFNGHTRIVEYLLQKGADVNIKDGNKRTALIYAASGNNAETVERLIEAGAELDHTDKAEHFTALMFAASEGQTEVVKILLNAGADKTIKDKDGETALDFARNNGHSKTAELLAE
jgi:ankyrin repeat protein